MLCASIFMKILIGNTNFDGEGVVDGVKLEVVGSGVLHCPEVVFTNNSSEKFSSTKRTADESHNCCGNIVSTSSSLVPKLRLLRLRLRSIGSDCGEGGGEEDDKDFIWTDIRRRTCMVGVVERKLKNGNTGREQPDLPLTDRGQPGVDFKNLKK